MVIYLGSEIGIPFRVWHEEKQQWIKCESNNPIRDRDVPRPTYRTVLVHVPNKGTRSERIPIPPESPVVRSVEHLQNLLQTYRKEGLQLAVEDAETGAPVRIVAIRSINKQQPAYIPTVYEHDTTAATAEELEDYRRRISASPGVSDDFPWYASAYWNDFVGGSTELWLPEQQQWLRADALEYPRCLPHGGNYLTTEREHGYGGHVRLADGSLLFDWFPVLYEVVTERPCTINIQAGYRNKLHRFTVRGQAHPATEVSQAPTHYPPQPTTTMPQENNTPTDKMQALLGAALHLPVIQCHKNDAPHKGELKEMSITEVYGFLNWVDEFFDLYVQDAETGAPVRICSCRYVKPNAQCEIYYLPLRKQRNEATPQVNEDSPAAAYVMHSATLTLIQHHGCEEWQPIAATAAAGAIPFGEGELVLQKSPACTQKFRQPAWWSPIKLPDICNLTFERHCTLHLLVGKEPAERFSLLVRGNSVPPPKPAPLPNKKRKALHQRTKRRKKKSKALPHVPLCVTPKPIVYKPNWEDRKAWLYELFENHHSIACLIEDHLSDKEYPTLAKLVNYTPQH